MSKWYVLLLKSKITFFFAIIGEYFLIKTFVGQITNFFNS